MSRSISFALSRILEMPPRISLQCLRTTHRNAPNCQVPAISLTICRDASTATQKRRRHDPYALAQAQAKKAANKSRQEVLKKERAEALGDPVRGITTPFVRSFDTATSPTQDTTRVSQSPSQETQNVNFLLSEANLEAALKRANWLHNPNVLQSTESNGTGANESNNLEVDSSIPIEHNASTTSASQKHASQLQNAEEAVRRIAALSLGSGKDKQRANNMRAIEVFGRHNTDATLRTVHHGTDEISTADGDSSGTSLQYVPRAGPDTGSSEVQIAILTAKIRTLADFLEGRGKKDKMNKRNLRLLVHRRQKLLQYLRRKERGGPRWQHVIDTLGLTEGTWKGEISL